MSVHVGNGTGTAVAEDEDLCMRAVCMLTPRLFLNTLPHNLHVLCKLDCEIAVDSVHCCWLVEDRGESNSGPTGQSGELIEEIEEIPNCPFVSVPVIGWSVEYQHQGK